MIAGLCFFAFWCVVIFAIAYLLALSIYSVRDLLALLMAGEEPE